ncbi:RHS repeat-associated core domain-containing protein [Luteimonas sp. 8-5]|uniref:RHS repeat-associated core domain-containing protein n=1 Tax=Luteimonas sp. 8-5 TaxID=3039387 RepID=UPI0031BADE0B
MAERSRPIGSSTETVTYQHTDALGSPVATTNSAKTVLQRSEYEPYGFMANRPMQDGPGYTGHITDAATGLVYMQQRYYDPMCGCFLSTDPVTASNGPFNRYWYANANPYKFTDPDGRQVSPPKSCHSDGSCIPLDQVNRGDATMMQIVATPVVVGGTAGLATASGATAATAATVRTVTPKVVEATAKAANAVNGATTSVAVRAQVAVEGELSMVLNGAGFSSATATGLAASVANPVAVADLIAGVVTGFLGVNEPPTSNINAAGSEIGRRLRVDYEAISDAVGAVE